MSPLGLRFFENLQEVYDELGESRPSDAFLPRPQQLPDDRSDIDASGLFEVIDITQYDWETIYDTDGYIDLLDTFSGHIAMPRSKRDHLDREIRCRLALRPDGQVRRHWGAVLRVRGVLGYGSRDLRHRCPDPRRVPVRLGAGPGCRPLWHPAGRGAGAARAALRRPCGARRTPWR